MPDVAGKAKMSLAKSINPVEEPSMRLLYPKKVFLCTLVSRVFAKERPAAHFCVQPYNLGRLSCGGEAFQRDISYEIGKLRARAHIQCRIRFFEISLNGGNL